MLQYVSHSPEYNAMIDSCHLSFNRVLKSGLLIQLSGESCMHLDPYQKCHRSTMQNHSFCQLWVIQLDPPSKVRLDNASKHSYNLTWELSDLSHYLEGKLEYQVQYKIKNSGEVGCKNAMFTMCFLSYYIFYSLKKVLRVHLPNPDEFFPSLNVDHGGDIQKWLSPPTSMASFHLATEGPEVSVLEIIQKDSQGISPFLSKEYCTNVNTQETSGHSLSSCFTNGGYFFFQHLNSFEIEPCKMYFTYDPLAQEGSDDDYTNCCSYKVLHETIDNSQLSPTYSNMATQENSSFLQESKDSTQKGGDGSGAFPSWRTFSTESSKEEEGTQVGSKPTVLLSKGPEEFPMGCSILPDKFNSGSNGTKAIQRNNIP
ncbi:hypothetical protein JD844_028396 [Phrynosoma platyrhinos]|uniref:Interleukin-2 receptor subunit beta n=1 Tax=Phrynosoma platyrhinos TaxID=52577 RepID=A0ABQ7SI57_PHRPL|nr:hypothetical protein JD844_028396 [Phrynosoma platyrhinos]